MRPSPADLRRGREPTPTQSDLVALLGIGWSRREVAAHLGISVEVVKSRAKRARQRARLGVTRDALHKREQRGTVTALNRRLPPRPTVM
jgi:DNA-binding NarL/FixJ family response regulator